MGFANRDLASLPISLDTRAAMVCGTAGVCMRCVGHWSVDHCSIFS